MSAIDNKVYSRLIPSEKVLKKLSQYSYPEYKQKYDNFINNMHRNIKTLYLDRSVLLNNIIFEKIVKTKFLTIYPLIKDQKNRDQDINFAARKHKIYSLQEAVKNNLLTLTDYAESSNLTYENHSDHLILQTEFCALNGGNYSRAFTANKLIKPSEKSKLATHFLQTIFNEKHDKKEINNFIPLISQLYLNNLLFDYNQQQLYNRILYGLFSLNNAYNSTLDYSAIYNLYKNAILNFSTTKIPLYPDQIGFICTIPNDKNIYFHYFMNPDLYKQFHTELIASYFLQSICQQKIYFLTQTPVFEYFKIQDRELNIGFLCNKDGEAILDKHKIAKSTPFSSRELIEQSFEKTKSAPAFVHSASNVKNFLNIINSKLKYFSTDEDRSYLYGYNFNLLGNAVFMPTDFMQAGEPVMVNVYLKS